MKILIIKTSSQGDIIHAFTTLGYLKQKVPDAEIDWVVESSYAELLEAHPFVNHVYCVDTKAWRKGRKWSSFWEMRKSVRQHRYDVVFDLQGNAKSGLLTFQVKAKDKVGFAYNTVPEWPNLLVTNVKYNPPKERNIREDYLYLAQRYFQDKGLYKDLGVQLSVSPEQEKQINRVVSPYQSKEGKRILVCPGSAWPNKQMSTQALINFLRRLKNAGTCHFFLAWGTDADRRIVEEIHENFHDCSVIIEKFELPVLQNLMAQLDLVIAMDSLPLHLAGTTSTPTFSVFGPSSSIKYCPMGVHHHAFQGSCPYGKIFEKRCSLLRTCSTGACIRKLSGDEPKIPWKNEAELSITIS